MEVVHIQTVSRMHVLLPSQCCQVKIWMQGILLTTSFLLQWN